MRLLLIEDDERIRTDVRRALEAGGFIVDCESDGEEGWFLGDTHVHECTSEVVPKKPTRHLPPTIVPQ